MFENSNSRTLPLPYPTLPSYKHITSSLPAYQLPPINVPIVKREDEIPIISIPKPLTPVSSGSTTQQLPSLHEQVSLQDVSSSSSSTTSSPPPSLHQQHITTSPSASSSSTTITTTTTAHPHRKKRQCPDCKLYFSNLATHKSTHLSINSRPHICFKCSRGFARSNDLIRHENSHLKDIGKFLYKCPFYQGECHSNGCFSRCDTFKNHLKALHFQYPIGTKKKDRSKVSGECKLCGEFFNNVDEWLKLHIDTNKCTKICNH